MLKQLIYKRYSGRIWEDKMPTQEQINYIIDCALKAPSKQSLYPWQLHVITQSKKGKKFKNHLFYNDTWCKDGLRIPANEFANTGKEYNGQYRAPLLLCWTDRALDQSVTNNYLEFKNKKQWAREQAIIDATVSSSFALLAAEELGLQTSFGRCHTEVWENSTLGLGSKDLYIVLGIGYAPIDPEDPGIDMLTPVARNGVVDGHDSKNMDQTWPLRRHSRRRNKPNKDELVRFV